VQLRPYVLREFIAHYFTHDPANTVTLVGIHKTDLLPFHHLSSGPDSYGKNYQIFVVNPLAIRKRPAPVLRSAVDSLRGRQYEALAIPYIRKMRAKRIPNLLVAK
jgi:hypothetical protein